MIFVSSLRTDEWLRNRKVAEKMQGAEIDVSTWQVYMQKPSGCIAYRLRLFLISNTETQSHHEFLISDYL